MLTVRRDLLGAWLMRRRPAGVDPAALAAGLVDEFCVRPSYRTALMEPGDRVLLWVSGRDPQRPRGLWALGALTGPAADRVGLELTALTPPVTDAELRAAGVDDLEVQRQPMGSNPSWLTRPQWDRVEALLRTRVSGTGTGR